MRICICGFYGWSNSGDEAILQSIMDELGLENEYIIWTSLPYCNTNWNNYYKILKDKGYNIVEIRSHEDLRTDFDCYLLGGGELNWGYSWRQCLSVFASGKPCMNYAVSYNRRWYYSTKLHKLYYEFLKNFDVITVRDEYSLNLLNEVSAGLGNLNIILTFDPAMNLKEQRFEDCPVGKIAVFPRFEDVVPNQPQLDWLMQKLKNVSNDAILIACAPKNIDGYPVDLELCQYLKDRLPGSQIINISPFEPRKVKYLVSQSRIVYSGGRYHPLIFAIAHDIPFKITPTANSYTKVQFVKDMYRKFGRDGLIKLAELNKKIFFDMIKK